MNEFTTKELLEEQIRLEIERLKGLKPGTAEYAACTESIKKLVEAKLGEDKCELDRTKHEDEIINESRAEDEEKKKRRIHLAEIITTAIISLAGIGVSVAKIIVHVKSMDKMFVFEEKGSIGSMAGKNAVAGLKNLLN